MPPIFDAFPAMFVVFGLLMVIAIIVASISSQKRREALAVFAQSLGMEFDPGPYSAPNRGLFSTATPDSPFFNIFDGFRPFGDGHSQTLSNLIFGSRNGLDWQIFDYKYETGSGDDETVHHYRIVAAKLPISLPPLTLAPESLGSKISQLFGGQDIKFELDAFNRRYAVRSIDERAAFDLITPQMIEYLMSLPPRSWQIMGQYVVLDESGTLEPPAVLRAMEEIEGFYQRIPNYVRQDAGR